MLGFLMISNVSASASPIVHFDAMSFELEDGAAVSLWDGKTAEGDPIYLKNQTPGGGPAVQFDGDDHFGEAILEPSDSGDFIVMAVVKPDQHGPYHNIIDDDDSNRPMLWVDARKPQSYEANFGVGGDGPVLPSTNSGYMGWDIVFFDSRNGKLYVNSPVPTHTAPAITWDAGEENFDFFNRDGKQAYRGLVAEVRVYNSLAAFGGSYERIYNELQEKWMSGVAFTATRSSSLKDRTSSQNHQGNDYWDIENEAIRNRLPLYKTIPASTPTELTKYDKQYPNENDYVDWHRSHGDHGSTRYSSLTQINRENVSQLKVAWIYRSGDGIGNLQCNPIVASGLMYTPTVGNHVVAVDAQKGTEVWRFKPDGRPAFRGITYWPGNNKIRPRLLFSSGNHLYALDPISGKPIAEFGQNGRVQTGECRVAPAIYNNIIIIAGYNKDAFGLDLESGKRFWTFHTIPRKGEFGFDTWDQPESGANCWGGTSLDQSRGIFYMTTGSPKPNFNGVGHRGRNLFANCLIAINAETGKRLWHFQEIRHDIWDLDIPAPPNLVTVNVMGKQIDAVAATTKIGNTLLLDRVSGKPIYPFRLRRAPVSRLNGEQTWPYQPDVQLPEPFARQKFSIDDVTNISPEARAAVMSQIENPDQGIKANFGWFEPFEAGKPTVLYGIHGGAEWTGACIDAQSGHLYVTSNELPWFPMVSRLSTGLLDETKLRKTPGRKVYELFCMACHGTNRQGVGVNPPLIGIKNRLTESQVVELLKTGRNLMPPAGYLKPMQKLDILDYIFERDRPAEIYENSTNSRPAYTYNGYPKLLDHEGFPGCKPPWGTLNCINLNNGKLKWQVPLGEHEKLTKRGVPKTGTENFGGAVVTAGGLVFVGGTRDIKFRAFDKTNGKELWEYKLPFGASAPPTVYQINGRQYVVVPATGGGKLGLPSGDAHVAFFLP
jgi:quinoprotein glucose dehydrogenase